MTNNLKFTVDGIDGNHSSVPQQLVHREAIEIMGTELRHGGQYGCENMLFMCKRSVSISHPFPIQLVTSHFNLS